MAPILGDRMPQWVENPVRLRSKFARRFNAVLLISPGPALLRKILLPFSRKKCILCAIPPR